MQTIYERLGDEKLQMLVDDFYTNVFADKRINHLFKNDIEEIKSKQFMFLTQFLGGPPRYSETHGHPRLRMKHLPHKIDEAATVAWLECMAGAISRLNIDEDFKDEIFSRFPRPAAHMMNS